MLPAILVSEPKTLCSSIVSSMTLEDSSTLHEASSAISLDLDLDRQIDTVCVVVVLVVVVVLLLTSMTYSECRVQHHYVRPR